ncbi:MAG: hypothetical protein ACRD1E_04440, partial [Terriglobales bacterium]
PLRSAWAGPPFRTDDPDPVAYRHWEVYFASTGAYNAMLGLLSTLPHVEVNYGAAPGLQLHVIVPMAIAHAPGEATQYGYGDTEIGAKLRFLEEGKRRPEVGVFPLVEVPSGDAARGLGAGFTQIFIPVWVQKSWGGKPDAPAWTSYGGAGWWRNPGPGNQNWTFAGWELQRNLSDKIMLGGEIFSATAAVAGAAGGTGYNLGGAVNFSDHRHLLYSLGQDAQPRHPLIWYAAYQWTF